MELFGKVVTPPLGIPKIGNAEVYVMGNNSSLFMKFNYSNQQVNYLLYLTLTIQEQFNLRPCAPPESL